MKKLAMCLVMVISALMSSGALAGQSFDWNIPDSIRIVQNNPVDNVRTFSSLSSAVASITGASESDPVMVIIMPGTYFETVSIPPYVSIMGTDKANTVLKNSGGGISLSNNSSAKNLTFYAYWGTNGTPLVLSGTNILLENVSADNESDHGEAIYIHSSSGIEIRDSDFTGGITVDNSNSVLIRDSQFFNTTKSWVPVQAALTEINGSSVEVQNSYFNVPIGYSYGNAAIAVDNNSSILLSKSDVNAENAVRFGDPLSTCTIAASRINGSIPEVARCKLVFNFDGFYNAIPNQ